MARVAVVGASGYVGGALCDALAKTSHTPSCITRENYEEMQQGEYDILINCAMPSGRFFAKKDPAKDFVETVQKTANLLYQWKFKKFVQISTLSARSQPETIYGRHKAAAERLCDYGENLIVRLGPMYSADLAKGALVDMKQGKTVFVGAESRYCFSPLDFVAKRLVERLDRTGIIEIGARNSMVLRDVAQHLGVNIAFEGPVDYQEIINPEPDFPDARDVLSFLDTWKVQ